MSPKKAIYIILGTISLFLGVIGIVVPGLPTTPFLLLTAGLYIRSSDRLYNKLVNNKYVGPYILEYQANRGMTKKRKIHAISIMWLMIAISTIFFIEPVYLKLIVVSVGIIGTIVMGFIVPTVRKKDNPTP